MQCCKRIRGFLWRWSELYLNSDPSMEAWRSTWRWRDPCAQRRWWIVEYTGVYSSCGWTEVAHYYNCWLGWDVGCLQLEYLFIFSAPESTAESPTCMHLQFCIALRPIHPPLQSSMLYTVPTCCWCSLLSHISVVTSTCDLHFYDNCSHLFPRSLETIAQQQQKLNETSSFCWEKWTGVATTNKLCSLGMANKPARYHVSTLN